MDKQVWGMPKDRKGVFSFQLYRDATGFINHFKGNACERTFAGIRICCASAVSWRHWVLREQCGVNSGCVLLFLCIELQHCHYKYRAWQKDRCITWLRRRGPDLSIVDNHVPTKLGDWEAFHNKTWQFQGHVSMCGLRRGCHCLRIFHPLRGRPCKGPKKKLKWNQTYLNCATVRHAFVLFRLVVRKGDWTVSGK